MSSRIDSVLTMYSKNGNVDLDEFYHMVNSLVPKEVTLEKDLVADFFRRSDIDKNQLLSKHEIGLLMVQYFDNEKGWFKAHLIEENRNNSWLSCCFLNYDKNLK